MRGRILLWVASGWKSCRVGGFGPPKSQKGPLKSFTPSPCLCAGWDLVAGAGQLCRGLPARPRGASWREPAGACRHARNWGPLWWSLIWAHSITRSNSFLNSLGIGDEADSPWASNPSLGPAAAVGWGSAWGGPGAGRRGAQGVPHSNV